MNKYKTVYFLTIEDDEVQAAIDRGWPLYATAYKEGSRNFIEENVAILDVKAKEEWEQKVELMNKETIISGKVTLH